MKSSDSNEMNRSQSYAKNVRATSAGIIVFVLGLGLGAVLLLMNGRSHDKTQSVPPSCFSYSHDDIVDFFSSKGTKIPHYFSLRRNPTGTKVYVCPLSNSTNHTVMIVSTGGIESVDCPGGMAFLNRLDKVIAWSDDFGHGVNFSNGYTLKIPPHGLFDIDPSGEYFLIGEKPSSSWIGRVDHPEERVCVSSNVLGRRLFSGGERLFISGQVFAGNSDPNSTIQAAACVAMGVDGGGFKVLDTIVFRWAAGIVDVDPKGRRLLLREASEFSPRWFEYELKTKRSRSFGRASGWCLFLEKDLLH